MKAPRKRAKPARPRRRPARRRKRQQALQRLSAATGVDYPTEEFLKCGERVWNLERLFNNRAGFSRKDDCLPARFFESGRINREEFEKALDEYYHFRGWDMNGVPSEAKLKELNLI